MSLNSYTPERDESVLEYSTWSSGRTMKRVPQLYQLMEKSSLNEYLATRAIAHKNPLDLFPVLGHGRLLLEGLHILRPLIYGGFIQMSKLLLTPSSTPHAQIWRQIVDALVDVATARDYYHVTLLEQECQAASK